MAWINEYHTCKICGQPYRTRGIRQVCHKKECLTQHIKQLLDEIKEEK